MCLYRTVGDRKRHCLPADYGTHRQTAYRLYDKSVTHWKSGKFHTVFKEGFFAHKRSLLLNANKACLECKQALFSNEGNNNVKPCKQASVPNAPANGR